MKILYILDPAIIGGATRAFITFISLLAVQNVTPIVCTAHQTKLNDELSSMGIINFPIRHREMITTCNKSGIKKILWWGRRITPYLIFDLIAILIIHRKVNMNEVDLIHTNSTRSDVGFFLSMLYKKPHVVHIREFGDKDYNCQPLNPFWRYYYNKFSSKFLCVSKAVMEHWIAKGINPIKCKLIYDGIAFGNITTSPDNTKFDKTLKIVMSGNVLPTKGQHLAIKAIGSLPLDIKKNISLDFIGWFTELDKEKLILMSSNMNLINPIKFWGARNDVFQLLKNYHVGLMCSKSEGFGLVTAEFMFANLGIIASNSGASPELIEDNICGLNFKVGDYKSLANKIQFYYNNRDIIVKHSNAARKKALKNFKASTNADNIHKVYNELLFSSIPPKS